MGPSSLNIALTGFLFAGANSTITWSLLVWANCLLKRETCLVRERAPATDPTCATFYFNVKVSPAPPKYLSDFDLSHCRNGVWPNRLIETLDETTANGLAWRLKSCSLPHFVREIFSVGVRRLRAQVCNWGSSNLIILASEVNWFLSLTLSIHVLRIQIPTW